MKTELICVGTELLEGKLNTNSSYIGERLGLYGLELSYVTTVGDNESDLTDVLKTALSRSDIIIATGGLGPTFDDMTREAVSKVTGKKLVLSREALSAIAARFVKRGIDMPKNNERQAYILESAKILPNPHGTAPGQLLSLEKPGEKGKKNTTLLFLLPGPPREMQAMFDGEVTPYLKKYETMIKKSFTLHVFGMSESAVDEKIKGIIEAERKLDTGSVSFTILAHAMIIDLVASVRGKDEMLVDEMLQNIKNEFYEVLGSNIYGENKATLEGIVGALLMKSGKTLSVAESCTGGLLAQKITSVPGSSFYFKQGYVTYSNESKIKLLGVSEDTIKEKGAVSSETALEMAAGCRKAAGTDFALSITGVAGPSGGTPQKPVGLVFVGFAGPDFEKVFKTNFPGFRADVRERAANHALDILRRGLLETQQKQEPKKKYKK